MTTIAVRDGIMASDTMMTGDYTSRCVKVIKGRDGIVGFSGDAIAGYALASWLADRARDMPDTNSDDDVECLILKPGGEICLADHLLREMPLERGYWAIGSGGQAAMVAMNLGCSAADAIREAMRSRWADDSRGNTHVLQPCSEVMMRASSSASSRLAIAASSTLSRTRETMKIIGLLLALEKERIKKGNNDRGVVVAALRWS